MFGLFKKKTERDTLLALYKKKKEEAYKLSTVNRKKSDEIEKDASDILEKIDIIDKINSN